MDAVEFVKERQRMCKSYGEGCLGCPMDGGPCGGYGNVDAERLVGAVEAWSAAHPRKTRQSVFLEQWPEAIVGDDGVLRVCPSPIFPSDRSAYNGCVRPNSTCSDCRREFWMQEVE